MSTPTRKRLSGVLPSAVLAGLLGVAYLLGGWAHREKLWPFGRGLLDAAPAADAISGEAANPAVGPLFAEFGRLSHHPSKRAVDCPRQTDRTMVALVFGQSNSANHGGERHQSTGAVTNYFRGACFDGSDPLLGATGVGGSPWGRMADRLIEKRMFDQVVLIAAGINRTSIERWRHGGDLNGMLVRDLTDVSDHYEITHFFWHQGESDAGRGEHYREALAEVIATTREVFPNSKFFVSVATRCGFGAIDSVLAREQMKVTDAEHGIFLGATTDDIDRRYDDCHFSGEGLDIFAERLVAALKREDTYSPAGFE